MLSERALRRLFSQTVLDFPHFLSNQLTGDATMALAASRVLLFGVN
jgi:hypothetical protein